MIKMVRNVSHDSTLTSFVCLIFGPCAVLDFWWTNQAWCSRKADSFLHLDHWVSLKSLGLRSVT